MKRNIVQKDLSYKITGLCFQIQNELGRFCREKQYCDRLEVLLREQNIEYKREYCIGRDTAGASQDNRVDFLIGGRIIVEVKAKSYPFKREYYQVQRYLRSADLELGLLINFRDTYLKPKRILNSHYSHYSVDSDAIRRFGSRSPGQGLLEAIIALGILMTGVVAVLTLALASLRAGVTSESRIVAANLAREGVEFVRNMRDSNWVKAGGTAWDDGLTDGTYVLRWDQVENQLTLQEASLDPETLRLYRSEATGIIAAGASLGTKTKFFRGIVLSRSCTTPGAPCIRVLSSVEWEERGRSARPHLDVVTELYQWR